MAAGRSAHDARGEQRIDLVQYQLLGLGSGFFAHMLATLMVCWRHMLRAAAAVAVVTALAVEALGMAVSHQFPPHLTTNLLAAALALGLGYGVGATIFASELVRGALRALATLQTQAGLQDAGRGEERDLAMGLPAAPSGGSASLPILPLALPAYASSVARPRAVASDPVPARDPAPVPLQSAPYAQIAPQVATSLPVSEWSSQRIAVPLEPLSGPVYNAAPVVEPAPAVAPAYSPLRSGPAIGPAVGEPFRAVAQDAANPTGDYEEDGPTVMLLPENSLYVPQFAARRPLVPAAAAPGASVVDLPKGFGGPLERGAAQPPSSLVGALPGALPPLASAAPVSPPPDLYAPWSAVPPLDPAVSPTGRTELDPALAGVVAPGPEPGARDRRGRFIWPRLARRS